MIGGRVLSLGIDSGAAGNLLDASLFDKLGNDLTSVTVTDLRGASKDVVEVKLATVKCLTIGGKQFQNIVTSFSEISHLNSRWDNKIDGLIGYEILSRQKTLVSVHSKKVVFIQ